MDYKTTVTHIGGLVAEFIEQDIIIVYNDNAPEELRDLSVGHTAANLEKDVSVGDTVILGSKKYEVSAVGSEANETLRKMGHCTLSFGGSDTAELPGFLELKGDGMPEIKIGDKFEILYSYSQTI